MDLIINGNESWYLKLKKAVESLSVETQIKLIKRLLEKTQEMIEEEDKYKHSFFISNLILELLKNDNTKHLYDDKV